MYRSMVLGLLIIQVWGSECPESTNSSTDAGSGGMIYFAPNRMRLLGDENAGSSSNSTDGSILASPTSKEAISVPSRDQSTLRSRTWDWSASYLAALQENKPLPMRAVAAIRLLDTNRDGVISKDEILASPSPALAMHMSLFDQNDDGAIQKSELSVARSQWRTRMQVQVP